MRTWLLSILAGSLMLGLTACADNAGPTTQGMNNGRMLNNNGYTTNGLNGNGMNTNGATNMMRNGMNRMNYGVQNGMNRMNMGVQNGMNRMNNGVQNGMNQVNRSMNDLMTNDNDDTDLMPVNPMAPMNIDDMNRRTTNTAPGTNMGS